MKTTFIMSVRDHSRGQRGLSLMELMVALGVMGIIAYATSTIYFSVLRIYDNQIWKLAPYDAATAAVQRLSQETRGAMLVSSHSTEYMVVIMPQKDANRDNVLTLDAQGYHLVQGDSVAFYLSDSTGSLAATGNCLWKAVKPSGGTTYAPKVKIADNVHPELNPTDPNTGQTRAMFKFWPDDVRLWGVEVCVTSTAIVHGQARTRTARSEVYLRNL